MEPQHWEEVRRIYSEGIATGQATFQKTAPAWEEWDSSHTACCRILAVGETEILGWAALTPVSGRCVYAGVAEVSVYVAAKARGKGVGKTLLNALIDESEKNDYWTLQSSIFPENKASIALHLNAGFRILGTRERIAKMDGAWHDTVILERRSLNVGID
jgi:phosphinothricin acetyltransferase